LKYTTLVREKPIGIRVIFKASPTGEESAFSFYDKFCDEAPIDREGYFDYNQSAF